MGYYFLQMSMERFDGPFLIEPRLAHTIADSLPRASLPGWYENFLKEIVIPNWQAFAYLLTYCELLIGISYLLGFMVRPVSALGILLLLNYIYGGGAASVAFQQTFLVLFIVMMWMGGGRCLGLDYYFYKRHRGIWW